MKRVLLSTATIVWLCVPIGNFLVQQESSWWKLSAIMTIVLVVAFLLGVIFSDVMRELSSDAPTGRNKQEPPSEWPHTPTNPPRSK